MRIADWLSYTDINQLKRLGKYYGCLDEKTHSKKVLIYSLLHQMGKKDTLKQQIESLTTIERRFLEQLVLDQSVAFTLEELLAKGRAALGDHEGQPRQLMVDAMKRGWLFPGYTHQTQHLYHIPSDTKEKIIALLLEPYLKEGMVLKRAPSIYRDEQNLMMEDLRHFLDFLQKEIVRLTVDGSIYRQQQKQLFKRFFVPEEPLTGKGPRFGFGRRYHVYPDRFSLLYDYAFYQGYIREDEEGYLCLTELGSGKIQNTLDEGRQLVRFWLRLYRRPIPQLPVIVRWFILLSHSSWVNLETVYQAIEPWLKPYYYESKESLFQKIVQMLVHLGVLKIGAELGMTFVNLSESGLKWMRGIAAFRERVIEDEFINAGNKQEMTGYKSN